MTKRICFATNNKNKLKEISNLVGDRFEIVGLSDIGCTEELAEDGDTLESNSLQKARYVFDHYDIPCFADDTGLEVAALNGAPGVFSARYAGDQRDSLSNMRLLLANLDGENDRAAQFRTVITFINEKEVQQFTGVVKGHIIGALKGTAGFGYDPIFQPEDRNLTFAEMSLEEKNKIPHRGRAFEKFLTFLATK